MRGCCGLGGGAVHDHDPLQPGGAAKRLEVGPDDGQRLVQWMAPSVHTRAQPALHLLQRVGHDVEEAGRKHTGADERLSPFAQRHTRHVVTAEDELVDAGQPGVGERRQLRDEPRRRNEAEAEGGPAAIVVVLTAPRAPTSHTPIRPLLPKAGGVRAPAPVPVAWSTLPTRYEMLGFPKVPSLRFDRYWSGSEMPEVGWGAGSRGHHMEREAPA